MIYLSSIPTSLVWHYLTYDLNHTNFETRVAHNADDLNKYAKIPLIVTDDGNMIDATYLINYKGKNPPKELPNVLTNTTYICFPEKEKSKWKKFFNESYVKRLNINLASYSALIDKTSFTDQGFQLFWKLCIGKFQGHIPKWIGESYKLSIYKEVYEKALTSEEIGQMYISKTSRWGNIFIKNFFSEELPLIMLKMSDGEIYTSVVGSPTNKLLLKHIIKNNYSYVYAYQLLVEALTIPTIKARHGVMIFHKWYQQNNLDSNSLSRLLNLKTTK